MNSESCVVNHKNHKNFQWYSEADYCIQPDNERNGTAGRLLYGIHDDFCCPADHTDSHDMKETDKHH
jgi:hypothetical protein